MPIGAMLNVECPPTVRNKTGVVYDTLFNGRGEYSIPYHEPYVMDTLLGLTLISPISHGSCSSIYGSMETLSVNV